MSTPLLPSPRHAASTTPVVDADNPLDSKENSAFSWQKIKTSWQKLRGGIVSGGASQVGIYHAENEDSYRCLGAKHTYSPTAYAFFAVSDGVGGGSHGDIASSTVLDFCAQNPARTDKPQQKHWAEKLNRAVQSRLRKYSDAPGAATLVAIWLSPNALFSFKSFSLFKSPLQGKLTHVGDCRAYQLRPSFSPLGLSIDPLTLDQTYHNLGLPIPARGSGDDPARMIGIGAAAVDIPPVQKITLAENELLLLCSDGVHKFLNNTEIIQIVNNGLIQEKTLNAIAEDLILAAKNNKSHDDVTAVLVQNRPWLGIKIQTRLLIELVMLLIVVLVSFGYY